jgi:hypothetical protein
MSLLIYIIVAKYLLIFVLKNPTELMSNFWNFFLNVLSLGLSFLSQIVYILLPGRMPIYFFICIGTNPREFENIPKKFNIVMQSAGLLCVALYTGLSIKLNISSKTKDVSPAINQRQKGWMLPPLQNISTKYLLSTGMVAFILLCILPLWLLHMIFLNSSAETLSLHPYQIIVHFNHHGNRFVCNLWTIFLLLSKPAIRRAILREIFDQFSKFKEMLGLE